MTLMTPETKILTTRGIIPVAHVNMGDCVYEYMTGKPLEIYKVQSTTEEYLYTVQYSDGTKEYMKRINTIPFVDGRVDLCPIDFGNIFSKPVYPDAYTAGALFTYGDFECESMGDFESMGDAAKQVLMTKYDYHNLSWSEFFPEYEFYAKSKNVKDPLIPNEYKFGSIKDRVQFIQGAFDAMYKGSMDEFPESIYIRHDNYKYIEELQWILRSTGVRSKIVYKDKRRYIYTNHRKVESAYLIIDGFLKNYPGFFYTLKPIEDRINRIGITYSDWKDWSDLTPVNRRDTIYIDKIFREQNLRKYPIYEIKLRERGVYYSKNLIPVKSV